MIILVGASASGKTEVAKRLIDKFNYQKVVTYTTREIRPLEQRDIDYHFVTIDQFKELKARNFFFEDMFYNNNYYGTSIADVYDNSLVILDPNGLNKYNQANISNTVSFFLDATKETREKRMISRQDRLELISKRIESDEIVFSKENLGYIDYIIDSNDITIDQLAIQINDLYQKRITKKIQNK